MPAFLEITTEERQELFYRILREEGKTIIADMQRHRYQDQDDWFQDTIEAIFRNVPDIPIEYMADYENASQLHPDDIDLYRIPLDALKEDYDGLRAWLHRWIKVSLRNRRLNAERDAKRRMLILFQAAENPIHWLNPERRWEDPAIIVIRKMERADILLRLSRLPRKLGDVALLRFEGLSFGEISDALGIPKTTVANRMAEIRSPRIRWALGL